MASIPALITRHHRTHPLQSSAAKRSLNLGLWLCAGGAIILPTQHACAQTTDDNAGDALATGGQLPGGSLDCFFRQDCFHA